MATLDERCVCDELTKRRSRPYPLLPCPEEARSRKGYDPTECHEIFA